jgi:hypothetical protein
VSKYNCSPLAYITGFLINLKEYVTVCDKEDKNVFIKNKKIYKTRGQKLHLVISDEARQAMK